MPDLYSNGLVIDNCANITYAVGVGGGACMTQVAVFSR
jgi:hypothetical protein